MFLGLIRVKIKVPQSRESGAAAGSIDFPLFLCSERRNEGSQNGWLMPVWVREESDQHYYDIINRGSLDINIIREREGMAATSVPYNLY